MTMRTAYTVIGAIAVALCPLSSSAAHLRAHTLFSAKLNGAQQVPVNSSTALGVAGLTLNPTRDTLCVNVGWTGLTSALTGLHIHEGAPGMNGPVLVDLMPFISGDHAMGMITGAALTPELIAMHLRGELYVNLHTTNNPNGEIRGHVLPETDHAFVADLNGAQQVPMVNTMAFGLGTFQLARHNGSLRFNVVLSGLSGPIAAAHFHMASMGMSGPVVQDLGAFISGNTISGEVDPTAFLGDLMAGNIYLNVHTDANPNGEIRGQLMMPMGLAFDATLNGMQQVPPVTTTAKGAASLVATYDLDSVWYDVVLDGLSGPVQAAHLHLGALGANGAVGYDLGDGIMGNRLSGWVTGITWDDAIELLEGNIYINLHTMANPNGEVRGQVYRYMREGYTIALDGMQQVPPANTTAVGAGIISVDRGQTNAHIMFVATPDMIEAAHLHVGVAGTNGPVVFDMASLIMDNAVFTYWKNTDATPFTTANSVQLRNDSVYVNVHTMDFPNGEVRGQVLRGAACTEMSTGLFEAAAAPGDLTIWPVPATGNLHVQLPSAMGDRVTLQVIDATGAVAMQRTLAGGQRVVQMDVSALSSGAYIVRLNDGNTILRARLIKD